MTPIARPRLRRRWPVVLAIGLLLAGLVLTVAATKTLPYYARSPGSVGEVTDFVTAGAETFRSVGDLYFLTVSQSEVSALGYLEALLDGEVDLARREEVRPVGVTREERKRQGLDAQEEAKQRAIFVALTRLGYEATFTGEGGLVVAVFEGSPAVATLEVDDVIVAADGRPVGIAGDLISILDDFAPGDEIVLTVERLVEGSDTEVDVIAVPLALGNHPEDPERGFIGVSLDTFRTTTDFPVDIEIDSQNIGGPSAGMMYTLGIIDLLSEEDLTRGHRIAGTGTIALDGTVGPIGGVRQKVFAARRAGAGYVLVPTQNHEDALTAVGDGIEIVPVDTIDDALEFLASLEPATAADRIAG